MKTLFLDLEETIIDNWHSFMFINVNKIKEFIKKENFTHVEIFSFAVENNDKKEMIERIPLIERVFNCKINRFFTIEEITEIIGIVSRFDLEISEIRQIFGKEFCLLKILLKENRKGEFTLLDDMIKHNLIISGENFKLNLINPETV